MLEFGPSGFLYLGLGDEGTDNDDELHGQNPRTLFGSILRLDVDNAANDFAASGNPFSEPEGLPQIWAIGLSNPWRGSFDPVDGLFYVGDDGASSVEINVLGTVPGANLGWSAYSGEQVVNGSQLPIDEHRLPYYTYDTSGESIVGGYVYRGTAMVQLQGFYLFGDTTSTRIGALNYCGDEAASNVQVVEGVTFAGAGDSLVSFGRDGQGELYIVSTNGSILRLIAPD